MGLRQQKLTEKIELMRKLKVNADDSGFFTHEMSLYMDILRFTAAVFVLIGHMNQDKLFTEWLYVGTFSSESVILFFVLSGFMITRSTLSNRRGLLDYISARMARIYSVVLPAIVFSVFMLILFISQYPTADILKNQGDSFSVWNFVSSVFFLNQSWGNWARVPFNPPYWSLCYEVWYYILFGIYGLVEGRKRIFFLILASVIAGPAILLLLPIWAAGHLLYVHGIRKLESVTLGVILFFGSFLLVFIVDAAEIDMESKKILHDLIPGFWRLSESQGFVTDYIICVAVILNLIGFTSIAPFCRNILLKSEKYIRFFAGCTFSIYLFHRPMTIYFGELLPNINENAPQSIIMFVVIFSICIGLALLSEHRLRAWRRGTDFLLQCARSRMSKAS